MLVFTDGFIQRLRKSNEPLPEYQRPHIYAIATEDRFQEVRDEIERWVALLPQAARPQVTANLQKDRSFFQAYHELAVGHALRHLSYEVEYQKEINGQRPDWYAYPKAEIPAFIVEVFTATRSETIAEQNRHQHDLLGRLEQIPVDALLSVRFRHVRLDSRATKRIANKVQKWLTEDEPSVGARLKVDSVIVELHQRGIGRPHVVLGATAPGFWVNLQPLRANIEDKSRKYRRLARDTGLPLVVAAVADPLTGLDFDDFEDVLLGQGVIEVIYEIPTGKVVSQKPTRKKDGLLRDLDLPLSAAIWVWRAPGGQWKAKAIHNPALDLLPTNAFDMEVI